MQIFNLVEIMVMVMRSPCVFLSPTHDVRAKAPSHTSTVDGMQEKEKRVCPANNHPAHPVHAHSCAVLQWFVCVVE